MTGDLQYDHNAPPATGEFEPVPNGTYPLAITASEKKVNGSNVGWSLTMQVLDGEHKGRSFRVFLNLQHENKQAQEIANKEFAAIREVTGVKAPMNMAELHHKPFMGKVAVTPPRSKDGKDYGPGNKVSQYLTIKGEKIGGGAPTSGNGTTTTQAPARGNVPQWVPGAQRPAA